MRKIFTAIGFLTVFFLTGLLSDAAARSSVQVPYSGPGLLMPEAIGRIGRSAKVDSLLYRNFVSRMKYPDMGYRVLIFSQSGNHSKNAAMRAMADFEILYPENKVYLRFEEPYFKVKVGNFTSRIDAEIFLRTIKPDYPYAFIVKDVLDIPAYLEIGK